ncbi:MAG TPA: DUF3810 domain-containing protein [Flavipsychrobacter sp.]|nr:DUF3810 domain-containing protein [Flavipsychrobacter sp.]
MVISKSYKKRLIWIGLLVALLSIVQFLLPGNSRVVSWYADYVFKPFQSFRNIVFGVVPFSVGDILYVLGLGWILYTAGKWVYFLKSFRQNSNRFVHSFMYSLVVIGTVYVVFLLGWGGNYYKSSLSAYWQLPEETTRRDSTLIAFDKFLISKINEYSVSYDSLSFKELDQRAKSYYKNYTHPRSTPTIAKASLFGNLMQYMRIQGYYNPFTGEAQINRNLPPFMLPFVICHEMAHQQGIAAEDDANLLAYAVGTQTPDKVFRYSSYFNIWLYTHRRLMMKDSVLAKQLKEQLNTQTLAHLEDLKAMRKKYDSDFSDYSGALYDGYLKLHHQNDGIKSYNKVWHSAWALEEKRKKGAEKRVMIP